MTSLLKALYEIDFVHMVLCENWERHSHTRTAYFRSERKLLFWWNRTWREM